MSTTQEQPQQQMAVPDHIDSARESIPDSTWAIVPRSASSVSEGWDHITYAQLAHAVDTMSHWIEMTCGVAEQRSQTMGYMGLVKSPLSCQHYAKSMS
jgi:hypothetical protein